ncbi:MAG TPA: hypothetical protein VHC22_20640 [Pirellulales bacterium]|nr:hypothetical protein [Pirellulales bacterium]
MKTSTATRILVCLAAACLGEGWLAGNSASASCGDYVMVGGHRGGSMSHTPADLQQTVSDDNGSPPCRGPHCSRGSDPLPAQPLTVLTGADDWCLPVSDVPRAAVAPIGSVVVDSHPCPLLRAETIFRPPRRA